MTRPDHKRALIVDDQESIRDLFQRLFETVKPDYEVVLASDGCAALELFQQQPFDLVVTDYYLPGLNGPELARLVRRISPDTRIVLMTGSLNGPAFMSGIESSGFDGFLPKPFTSAQVLEVFYPNHNLNR